VTASSLSSTRVSEGARLLDRQVPGWWRAIDARRLDTSAVRDCILGQLVRRRCIRPTGDTWFDMLHAIGLADNMSVPYGFDASPNNSYARNCEVLDAHWRQEINRRASAR
jgi:hypothetical protein